MPEVRWDLYCKFPRDWQSEILFKSASMWLNYRQEYGVSFFDSQCITSEVTERWLHYSEILSHPKVQKLHLSNVI